jgi:hypothetical protein
VVNDSIFEAWGRSANRRRTPFITAVRPARASHGGEGNGFMAYVPEWERLSDVVARVMAAGLSRDEAQSDICRAIAVRAVKIQGQLGRHTIRGTLDRTVLEGKDIQIPTEIKPEDLDWERSRPVRPWFVRREPTRLPGPWALEWIVLSRTDVTNAWCTAGKQSESALHASRGKGTTNRSQPGRERAQRVLNALYPDGPPDQATVPNANLCGRVGDKLKELGLPAVSDDTILRAAGRRK